MGETKIQMLHYGQATCGMCAMKMKLRDDDLAITLADYTDWAKQEFYKLTSEDYHNNSQAV